MSAWKSPLLFIGVVLIAAAAAALLAPLYVDWNTYRAEFEDYGRQVTGRAVTIEGPIEARLFPWPVLVLNDVKVANVEGTLAANLMEAGRIEMGMSLAPLMSGQIEVDTVTGKIRTKHVYAAHDCGLIINPNTLEQQIEGCVIQGVSRGLLEEVTFSKSRVTSLDWESYSILRYKDAPEITPILLNRPDFDLKKPAPHHGGAGEAGEFDGTDVYITGGDGAIYLRRGWRPGDNELWRRLAAQANLAGVSFFPFQASGAETISGTRTLSSCGQPLRKNP